MAAREAHSEHDLTDDLPARGHSKVLVLRAEDELGPRRGRGGEGRSWGRRLRHGRYRRSGPAAASDADWRDELEGDQPQPLGITVSSAPSTCPVAVTIWASTGTSLVTAGCCFFFFPGSPGCGFCARVDFVKRKGCGGNLGRPNDPLAF